VQELAFDLRSAEKLRTLAESPARRIGRTS
jgi:hypothetical protein